ncbi:MAG: autotransporter-associated beta strand repeat-containing protein [Opitutaceae bacterium]|jgi:autotransporter-associated beta strand protein
MKTRSLPALSRSPFAAALLAALVLPSALAVRAATITYDANDVAAAALVSGSAGTLYDTAANWVGNVLPVTTDEVLFDNSVVGLYPAVPPNSGLLTTSSSQTWGGVIWNSNDSGGIATTGSTGNKTLTLSGGAGSTAAIAAGGASGDLITVGSAVTSGTFSLYNSNGTGTSRLFLTLGASGNINVVNSGATLALAATLQGLTAANSTVTKTGAGTLTLLNGNNALLAGSNSGRKFILDGGTLNFNTSAGFSGNNGGATFEIHGGTFLDNSTGAAITLAANNAQSWTGDFTYKGTGNSLGLGTGAVTLSGPGSVRTVTVSANTLTVGGAIGGTGYGLTKAGAGALTLGAANTYDGATTISGGTLSTGAVGALPGTTEVIVSNGTSTATAGTLNINGFNQTVTKLSSSVTGAGTTKGVIMNNGANSTATLTVTGTSTFDGTLKNGTGAPTTRILALEKSTGGTLRLTGIASTYTGGTTVSGGTLLANNASGSATGTGAVTVNGGFFGGTGSSSGAITVNAGGAITPGDGGAGTFTGGSSLTWNSDDTLAGMTFDLGVNQAATDQLALAGAFTKGTGSTFVFSFIDAGYTPSIAYTLVTFGSTGFVAGDFSATGIAGSFAIVGNSLQFTAAAIPEPSTYAAILGAFALGIVVWCKRRRRA